MDPGGHWGTTEVCLWWGKSIKKLVQLPVPWLVCAPLMTVPWPFFWSCPQAPCLVFFNCKIGSFCSRAGVCGLSWDFTALLSSLRFNVKYFMGSGRQFCKPAWVSAHGRWTGFREWVQIHRSWLCFHLPTTVSLTKFTFSASLFVKRKLLSVWAPVWARESQGVCRWHGNPQPGWEVGGGWGRRSELEGSSLSSLTQ